MGRFARGRAVWIVAHLDHPQPPIFVKAYRDRIDYLRLARHQLDSQASFDNQVLE
jgi:hypothetical protein